MSRLKHVLGLLFTGATLMVTQAAPGHTPGQALQGQWAGERMQLTADASGVKLQSDCASGTIVGALTPAGDGRFSATGTYEPHTGGPQRGDEPAALLNARYSGELRGGVLTLNILPAGASTPLQFTLREGVRIKLIRCM